MTEPSDIRLFPLSGPYSRVALHVAFWLVLGAALFGWFSAVFYLDSALWLATSMIVLLAPTAYLNTYWLLPRVLFRYRLWVYVLVVLCVLAAVPILWYFLTNAAVQGIRTEAQVYLLRDDQLKYIGAPTRFRFIGATAITALVLFTSTIIGVVRRMIDNERQAAAERQEHLQQELAFLRGQVNPHFLFNALNNLYAMIQLRPDDAGEFVLKLSDLLRYGLYESRKKRVTLKQELTYIQDLIYFEREKTPEGPALRINLPDTVQADVTIEPLLLAPFVENAFKHSFWHNDDTAWIELTVDITTSELHFLVANSVPENRESASQDTTASGIGVENVRRRLNLRYGDAFDLDISQEETTYTVDLRLPLHAPEPSEGVLGDEEE